MKAIQHIQQHKKGGTRVSAKDARQLENPDTQGALPRGVNPGRHCFSRRTGGGHRPWNDYAWLKNDPEYAKAFNDAEEAVQPR